MLTIHYAQSIASRAKNRGEWHCAARALLLYPAWILSLTLTLLGLGPSSVAAQHSFDVQQAEARAEYRSALKIFDRLPERVRTRDAVLSAARSAWALGLVARARSSYQLADRLFEDKPEQQAKILLSLAILEYQEGDPALAIMYAQRVCKLPKQSGAVRGRAELLWGQALLQQGAHGKALPHFTKALLELPAAERADAYFSRGKLLLQLGNAQEARKDLESVPLEYEKTPEAIRLLALSSIETEDTARAWYWLKKGRDLFPDRFLDSWVDYALANVAMSKQDVPLLDTLLVEAGKRYPASDGWLTLMQASAEAYKWARLRGMPQGGSRQQ